MLSFKVKNRLLGCGIDTEHIIRFAQLELKGNKPSPFIFSPKEIEYCSALADSWIAFCTAFCCKEALFKALQSPYDFTACELLWNGKKRTHISPTLSKALCKQHHITDSRAYIEITDSGECIVSIFLFGQAGG